MVSKNTVFKILSLMEISLKRVYRSGFIISLKAVWYWHIINQFYKPEQFFKAVKNKGNDNFVKSPVPTNQLPNGKPEWYLRPNHKLMWLP
jgi:hypothetical protein